MREGWGRLGQAAGAGHRGLGTDEVVSDPRTGCLGQVGTAPGRGLRSWLAGAWKSWYTHPRTETSPVLLATLTQLAQEALSKGNAAIL